MVRRKSLSAYWVCALKRPLKKPFPSGLYATKPIWLASQKANNAFSGGGTEHHGILVLRGGNGRNGVGGDHILNRRVGHAPMMDFACLNQFAHYFRYRLGGYIRVNAMLVIQVDVVGLQIA